MEMRMYSEAFDMMNACIDQEHSIVISSLFKSYIYDLYASCEL
jgi:hypothetical protein